jgi:hypothetical protein
MSSVRKTGLRRDALRERLRDPAYARAYRDYVISLARRVRATMAGGRDRTRRARQTVGSSTRAVAH